MAVLSYLGWEAYPIARLAEDAAGSRVRQDLRNWGVHLDYIGTLPTRPTPVIVEKIRDVQGVARHSFSWRCPDCGGYFPSYSPILSAVTDALENAVDDVDVFFMDRVSRGVLVLAKHLAERGVLVVFEPSGVNDPGLFREALSICHIIKYSHERMQDAGEILVKNNAPELLLQVETLGGEGVRFRSFLKRAATKGWVNRKAFSVERVRDTAGAGDWLTAGLLHSLAEGGARGFVDKDMQEIEAGMSFGQALAAWTCRFEGARGGMYVAEQKTFMRDVQAVLRREVEVPEEQHMVDGVSNQVADFCATCADATKVARPITDRRLDR